MSDLFNNLSSPSWWIGVVIVSFAINLASAYAKAPLDRALGRLSKRKRDKSERARREISTMLEAAKRQKDGVVLLSIQELRLAFIGITIAVLCILLLLLLKLESSALNLTSACSPSSAHAVSRVLLSSAIGKDFRRSKALRNGQGGA